MTNKERAVYKKERLKTNPNKKMIDLSGKVTYNELVVKFKENRLKAKLSQFALSKELGISEKSIGNFEKRRHVASALLLEKIKDWIEEANEAKRMASESLQTKRT